MTDHDERLAEYLAGEMNDADRAAFERAIREDPALAREATSLARAQRDLKSLAGTTPESVALAATRRDSVHAENAKQPVGPSMRWGWIGLAASLAFVAGFMARGPSNRATMPDDADRMAIEESADSVQDRFLRAYAQRASAESSLGRTLLTLGDLAASNAQADSPAEPR